MMEIIFKIQLKLEKYTVMDIVAMQHVLISFLFQEIVFLPKIIVLMLFQAVPRKDVREKRVSNSSVKTLFFCSTPVYV